MEDKRDIIKRLITSMAELGEQDKRGQGYRDWREELYGRMTHYKMVEESEDDEESGDGTKDF